MGRLRQSVAENVYAKLFRSPHWRVGWRHVSGPDLWDTQSLADTRWNRPPDPGIRFFADPMALAHDGRTILLVEDFHHHRQKGVISAVELTPAGPVGPVRQVLEEPWRLSYPHVFEHDGAIWMIPESCENRQVVLYRADPFPDRWTREAVLIEGLPLSDATLVQHDGLYWLLATLENPASASADLGLFHAASLFGPWRPHQGNPVLHDARTARSAGPIVRRDGRLWRPVQDCSYHYGAAVGLAEITRLDTGGYEQKVRSTLAPCRAWPGRRLHTLSQCGGFKFIDGSANVLRWSPFAGAI